jgi:hypothetical protein
MQETSHFLLLAEKLKGSLYTQHEQHAGQAPNQGSCNQPNNRATYLSAVFISFSNPSTASPFWDSVEAFSVAAPSAPAALRAAPRTETGGLLSCTGDLAVPEGSFWVGVFMWSCWLGLSADSGGEDKPDSGGIGLGSAAPAAAAGWSGGGCGVCVRGGGWSWSWMPLRWGVDAQNESLWYLRLWASKADSLRSNWWSLTCGMAPWIRVRSRVAFCAG